MRSSILEDSIVKVQEKSSISINLLDMAQMISVAVDLMEDGVYDHGQRVAYIAYRLFKELYPNEDAFPIVLGGFMHDIGIDTNENKKEARNFIVDDHILQNHTQEGEMLLKNVDLLKDISPIIKHHHTLYMKIPHLDSDNVPIESQIINLADRVEILIDPNKNILSQENQILDKIRKFSGTMFNPIVVDCFIELTKQEAFWLDINNKHMNDKLWKQIFDEKTIVSKKDIRQLAGLCGEIVDRKSSFTRIHSKYVASISKRLGKTLGMDEEDQFMLEIAGELHDLGKLSIPHSVLHKEGKLTEEEYKLIKQHTYYTYYLIDRLNTMEKVRDWAAFHHERLDGNGYPFRLKGHRLDLGARVLAVADITAALSEDRPYRKQLPKEKIMDNLWKEVKDNKIDGDVVSSLERNFEYIRGDYNAL